MGQRGARPLAGESLACRRPLAYEYVMPRPSGPRDLKVYLAPMADWPRSWAGTEEDVPIGAGLVDLLKAFVRDLHERGLSHKTIRRHLDNAWSIGGEVITCEPVSQLPLAQRYMLR